MRARTYIREMQIGQIRLANNLALAPLAGTSDLAFRRICSRLGAGLVITELVSARGIIHDLEMKKNWRYLAIDPAAGPVGIQLFGTEPADFAKAVRRILDHPVLAGCSLIDVNMGCPVKKVVKTGAGSALMLTPQKAAAIVKELVKVCGRLPVTVKIRSGWDMASINAAEFARYLEDAGASGLAVHARTREQMYGGKADWSILTEVKQAVTIPVWGNGDIIDSFSARQMLEQTGVDGLMVGRAAQGNPWIFRQLTQELACASYSVPEAGERLAVIKEHLAGLIESLGERAGVREMRSQLVFYLRGARNAKMLRALVMQAENREQLLAALAKVEL